MRSTRIASLLLGLLISVSAAMAAPSCPPLFGGVRDTKQTREQVWKTLADSKLSLTSMRQAAFLLVAPTSEKAFENTFGGAQIATARNIKSMQSLAAEAKTKGFTTYSEPSQGSAQLRRVFADPALKLIVIAGHNEGGRLSLPDGSRISIQGLLDGITTEKLVIVVACHVKDEAPFIEGLVDGAIRATDALKVISYYASEVQRLLTDGRKASYRSFIKGSRTGARMTVRMDIGGLPNYFRATTQLIGRVKVVTVHGPCLSDSPDCRSATHVAN